jgi:TonB family protein
MAAQREAAVTHPYGAYELKLLYTHHLSFGLSLGIGLLLVCIVVFFTFTQLKTSEPKKTPTIISIDNIPQPTLYPVLLSDGRHGHSSVAKNGIPVPVPDLQAKPEEIPADQITLSQTSNASLDGLGDGSIIVQPVPDDMIAPEPDMNIFHAIEIEPQVIHSIVPDYPEIARRSIMEGKVIVKVLVDKDGKVRKSAVIFSDNEVFNQSSLNAAGQYVFTPGMMNNGPVWVWVTVRFEFKLR